jgi:uncharacterized phage protein gp47/JayE
MPLTIPTSREVDTQGQSYLRAEVPELSAVARRGSFISGLTTSFFLSVHGLYRAFKRYADNEPFPQTASESFFRIGWWLDITGLSRNQPAAATGYVVLTGAAGTLVAGGTSISSSSGQTYTTDNAVTVVAQSITGESQLTLDQSVGRFVTTSAHNLASGMSLLFSGCIDASLNGTFEIRVVDATTIEYDLDERITGVPLATNPLASGTWANVTITADNVGTIGNLNQSGTLTITTPPAGLDATALVTFDGLADGADLETMDSWRERVLEGLATDFGTFTADEIKIVAKTVPGVTRVFVRKPTRTPTPGYPLEGQVKIAFLREDDDDPLPSAAEVEQVRQVIHDQLLPAHTLAEDVTIMSPERYNLNVRFRSITPDTPGMRASIRNNLIEFLAVKAAWGGVLYIEDVRCAIRAAYDADTGQALDRYELDTPTLDVALPVDAFPVLSSIAWSI